MISFPYTSVKTIQGQTVSYDRAIDSRIKRLYNKLRYKQGVAIDIGDAFQVIADTGMNVKVKCNGSWAHVGGDFCYESAESRVLSVQAPDTTYDRIDLVVLRNDISQAKRAVDLYVVQGTPASSPQTPALTNTPEVQEICLATLFISKNVNTISQDRISDTRLDTKVCGVLANAFGEVDASQFLAQANKLTEYLKEEIKKILAGSETMLKALYDPQGKETDIFKYAEHPVGYIFDWAPVADDPTDLSNPEKVAQYFGYGTWAAFGEGQFLLGNSEGYQVGDTGGEATHTLTLEEIPAHNHDLRGGYGEGGTSSALWRTDQNRPKTGWGTTGVTGGGAAHNNMPPYVVVYRWQRIA